MWVMAFKRLWMSIQASKLCLQDYDDGSQANHLSGRRKVWISWHRSFSFLDSQISTPIYLSRCRLVNGTPQFARGIIGESTYYKKTSSLIRRSWPGLPSLPWLWATIYLAAWRKLKIPFKSTIWRRARTTRLPLVLSLRGSTSSRLWIQRTRMRYTRTLKRSSILRKKKFVSPLYCKNFICWWVAAEIC